MPKLTKTETKLLERLEENKRYGFASIEGLRELNAAKKLHEKGLVEFTNMSEYVPPIHSNIRRRTGDYVGFWSFCGNITPLANN